MVSFWFEVVDVDSADQERFATAKVIKTFGVHPDLSIGKTVIVHDPSGGLMLDGPADEFIGRRGVAVVEETGQFVIAKLACGETEQE